MASNDGVSPPPVLTIDDDEDDGYPTTPPILEREVYIDETVKAVAEKRHEDEPESEGEQDYQKESAFPLPKKMRSLNPKDYYRHSNVFLFEVVCILCQRVCNDTHVVLCGQFHRFCKSCIMPRWDEKCMKCPRCNGNVAEAPQPDPVFDNIIKALRYDRKKVNYLHIEESSSGEDSASDESDIEDRRNGNCSGFASGEESTEDKDGRIKPYFHPPKERWTNTSCPDENWLIRRYKRRKNEEVRGTTPPYRFPPSSPNARIIPAEWHMDRRRKPLEGMIYKNFECNSGHKWPANVPPPPPHGMSIRYFKNVAKIQKVKQAFMNIDYLSKREKKILIHQQISKICDPDVMEQFESSSDDDEPPKKIRKSNFDYPDNYRKPRRNWRAEFNADGTRKVKKGEKPFNAQSYVHRIRQQYRWNKDWGNPVLMIRENSAESSFPSRIFSRIYIATFDDTTIAHLRVYVYNKMAANLGVSNENVIQRYQIDFYAVLKTIPGKKVNIIKCDENVGRVAAAAARSPSKSGQTLVHGTYPFCGPSTSGSNMKRFNGSSTSAPFHSIHIDGKKVIFPFGRKEPTVREFALKTMALKDDRVMASNRRMMMAPPFPDNSLRIESVAAQNAHNVQAVTPTAQPPPQSCAQIPSEGKKELQPLFPVQRKLGPPVQAHQLPRIEPRPVMPKPPPEEIVQLIQTIDPETKQISYSQLTHDGKLIPFQQQRFVPLSPQRVILPGVQQQIAVSPTKRNGPQPVVVSPPQNIMIPRRLSAPAVRLVQATEPGPIQHSHQQIAVQGAHTIAVQSPPQPIAVQSTSQHDQQAASEQQKGTAQGFSLDKPCTVYSTRYPLRPLEESVSCGELRKMSGIHGGTRLVVFFSIKDRMPQLNPIVGPSRP